MSKRARRERGLKFSLTALAGAFSAACLTSPMLVSSAVAQQPDRTVLPLPPAAFTGRAGFSYKESTPAAEAAPRPPAGAPNVLLVLIDDAGFGQCDTFGGLIPTPTLNSLAAGGLRYNRFHVTALCSPTRAALLTGRNHHAVNMGSIENFATDFPGYNGAIPASAAMLPKVLQMNGYATAAFGKWHLIPENDLKPTGPFDRWPSRQGFDSYYGFLEGETDQWFPELTEGTKPVEMVVPPGRVKDFTLNEDLANHAIDWIRQEKSLDAERPFFVYFAPGATHTPLQAPKAYIDPFRGQFDMGWDRYREIVFERQKKLGVIPKDAKLTPRPAEIPAWDSLSDGQKKVASRLMEVFAGFMAQTDHEIGRVLEAIRDTGQWDNTLVMFIAGDNGASLEGGLYGTANTMAQINGVPESTEDMLKVLDELGGPTTTPHYPVGWAWAGNTPFQWGKRIGSHLGGTRDPLVVSWPRVIQGKGGLREQFEDVTDIAPTILEAAHLPIPVEVNGVKQQRMDGVSMVSTFQSAAAPETRTTQYFEMGGNRAMYSDGWMAATRSGTVPWIYAPVESPDLRSRPWELYHLSQDYSEAVDLAQEQPQELARLQAAFDIEAKRNHVYPLDPRFGGARQSRPLGKHFRYTTSTGHLYVCLTPVFENHSHSIDAYVDIPNGGGDGVLVADGGEGGGFSLFIQGGKPTYTYNYFKRHVTTIQSPMAIKPGPAHIHLEFAYDGGGVGKGANATLSVNDEVVGRARIPETVHFAFSFEETFDIGQDTASPVGGYESPFAFAGTIHHIDLNIR